MGEGRAVGCAAHAKHSVRDDDAKEQSQRRTLHSDIGTSHMRA